LKYYNQEAKPQQIDALLNLVRGRNTFLLAGTGFGKSRIPELYFRTLPIKEKAVILVLNPLDSLGDNQVLEKSRSGFTAINLTKLTICPEECDKIANGDYNFFYLSPEIFLNSKLWDRIYFSNKFQQRLGLVVVDEAHMVYKWGIVEKTHGRKRSSALGRHEDCGIFRPSYGNLGGHLMTRNNMPILLMSATCRPVAIKAIRKSLKLPEETLWMLRAELTRPEICFIRVTMDWSMVSCNNLLGQHTGRYGSPDNNLQWYPT
jgi:superfamily II DNA helicase RecQ